MYSLGPQVLTLAAAARAGLPVVKVAEPFMDRLVREVQETVVLSVWDGECPIVVATDDGTDAVARVTVRLGARLSPTASARGRVFCAYLPPEEVPILGRELRASPELGEELDAIRSAGVCVESLVVNGLRTIAAPVFQGGRAVAALAVIAPSVAVGQDDKRQIQALIRTADNLSSELGRS